MHWERLTHFCTDKYERQSEKRLLTPEVIPRLVLHLYSHLSPWSSLPHLCSLLIAQPICDGLSSRPESFQTQLPHIGSDSLHKGRRTERERGRWGFGLQVICESYYIWVVAREGGLVELGSLPTHKAVLVHPVQGPLVVIDGDADVEDLAPVVHIGVVAVACVLLVAVEPVIIRSVQKVSGRGGQTLDGIGVLLVLGLVVLGQVEAVADEV